MIGTRIAASFAILAVAFAAARAPATGAAPCNVSNTTPLTFDLPGGEVRSNDARASFVVTCARSQTVTISLLYSHHLKGERGDDLTYDLYSSPNHSAIWGGGGDGAPVTLTVAAGSPTTLYIYARIPGNQRLPAGHFTDNIEIEALPF